MIQYLTIYTLSYFTITSIFVYILNLPQIITNDKKGLIKEYYIKNFVNVIILDYFLILAYLTFNNWLIKIFKINTFYCQILMNILGTILLNKNSFFSKWFYSVKWKAVVYDIFLIVLTFLLIKLIYNILNN